MEQNKQSATEQNAVIVSRVDARQDDAVEIDLVELFYILLHSWKLLLLAFIMGVVIMAGYHGMFVKPTYRASTEIYITNTDSVISLQDLQLGSALTEDYKSIITSRAVMNKVIEDLQLNTNYKGLRKLITVSNPSGTHIIRTSVTTTNMETSRNIANDLLNVSIDRIFQVIGTSEPTIIDYSEAEAVENVTPSIIKYMAIGGIVGLLLFAAIIVIRMLMDNTVKNDDDVEKYLHLPVLSAVPYFED
ncbi:MAG: hypothetical protein IJ769_06955 [Clostridia bacterium]|nr:hypothetical protein [Clostridia bacterium]